MIISVSFLRLFMMLLAAYEVHGIKTEQQN